MASFASVKNFAYRVDAELERVDVFLANAGIQAASFEKTGDGWESTCVGTLAILFDLG